MRGLSAFLDRLKGAGRPNPVRIIDLGPVQGPVYAIGDVHGSRALLTSALEGIRNDASGIVPTIILLGDLVDRGADTAGVLDDLTSRHAGGRTYAVLGNHERMMLSFLDDPLQDWDWLSQGGFETLRSYGLSLPPSEKKSPRRLRQILAAHIPDSHVEWLRNLAHIYRAEIGGVTYVFTHAGIDGTRPLEKQDEQAVLWGRNVAPPTTDICVVQGHVIVREAQLTLRLIRIDTGAYESGILTVLRVSAGKQPSVMSFIEKTN